MSGDEFEHDGKFSTSTTSAHSVAGLAVAAVVCEAMVERGAGLLAGDVRIPQD